MASGGKSGVAGGPVGEAVGSSGNDPGGGGGTKNLLSSAKIGDSRKKIRTNSAATIKPSRFQRSMKISRRIGKENVSSAKAASTMRIQRTVRIASQGRVGSNLAPAAWRAFLLRRMASRVSDRPMRPPAKKSESVRASALSRSVWLEY